MMQARRLHSNVDMIKLRASILAALAVSFSAATAAAQTEPPPPLAAAPEKRALFIADPVIDGSVLALGGGWAILSTLIIGTGEVRPQQIDPSFKTQSLLPIDRDAVNQTIDTHAALYSNVGLGLAIGYAFLDPVLSAFREKSARTGFVDGLIYLEAIAVTSGVTNLSKLAVRRPRPIAYIEFNACEKKHPTLKPNQLSIVCDNTSTDSSLSFVSGHASTVGTITGVATYLAFARSPHSWRPWATLLAGAATTFFVSFERVRAGDHFPTDVIAGSFGGAGVGVLTAHLHRDESTKLKPLWIGWNDSPTGSGGALTLNGMF
jgi:membrane-associated phospholipid phosphatase